jgi:hypothetical protein
MRKPEIGYSAARLLVGRPTITKYSDQRQLGVTVKNSACSIEKMISSFINTKLTKAPIV